MVKAAPFSAEESRSLSLLKEQLTSEEREAPVVDNYLLMRFLQARDMDVDKAADMVSKHLAWRKETDADSWLSKPTPPKYEHLSASTTIHKTDRNGNPVIYWNNGHFYSHMARRFTLEEWTAIALYDGEQKMDTLQKLSREQERLVRFTFVGDLTGIASSAAKAQSLGRQVSLTLADNYPEVLEDATALNVPWLATMLWKVFKRFVDPDVVAKTHLHAGVNIEELKKRIPMENIPKKFGGLCECPGGCVPEIPPADDPDCYSYSGDCVGASKEPSSISKVQLDYDSDDPETKEVTAPNEEDMVDVTIGAGSSHEVTLSTPPGKEKCDFIWYFETSGDVDFSVTFFSDDGEDEELAYTSERVQHGSPVVGSYSAKKPGRCEFHWGNGFSYFRSKTINYYARCEDSLQ